MRARLPFIANRRSPLRRCSQRDGPSTATQGPLPESRMVIQSHSAPSGAIANGAAEKRPLFRVLVSDSISESGLAPFRADAGIQVEIRTELTPADLIDVIPT